MEHAVTDYIPAELLELRPLVSDLLESSTELSSDDLRCLLGYAGRNNKPGLFCALYFRGRIPQPLLPWHVANIWSAAELPEHYVSRSIWTYLFTKAGYTYDGKPTEKPPGPITLYRGCSQYYTRRMSWTCDRDMAEWYGTYRNRNSSSHRMGLYEVTVQPERLLAYIGPEVGRDESEYVIDPTGSDFKPRRITRFESAA